MNNLFDASIEQDELVKKIREGMKGDIKHIRLLGDPGLGKTRIVLEAVKDESIRSYVLYFQYGTQFSQTKLFRQLIRFGYEKPLILVIDELPEKEMSEIWRHLKPRCGALKIITIDHGSDETYDEEIERLTAPRLPDEIVKNILIESVGERPGIERWTSICEGSPRVTQAVAENLRANPEDLLKPPSTIPIWSRFLHGYGDRDATKARQIDCVAQYLSLFSRFGYEEPVSYEAVYIAEQIKKLDPTIGWAQFQEIVQGFRSRRVLQGNKTLFFVPKALHIYLWRQFWEQYGRGFEFVEFFNKIPLSLQAWFMNMFKFADGKAAVAVIQEILKPNGIFYDYEMITSEKGSRFLSILAEANPLTVLRLLEATVGKWTDEQLLSFKVSRQNLVWTLEKIAVWPTFTVRAIGVLSRLAFNENADFSNNATGTLVGLFRIGPESAATEASPKARLPAMLRLLRDSKEVARRIALKAMEAALQTSMGGFRIIGPEYQGLRERASLWMPTTYGELWEAQRLYFQTLIDETRNWPLALHLDICISLLNAVDQLILVPSCTELAFDVLDGLINDDEAPADKLNNFFWSWREYKSKRISNEIKLRILRAERRYTRRSLASRFQRYVVDVEYLEWDSNFRKEQKRRPSRAHALVDAVVDRIVKYPEQIGQILKLLTPTKFSPALRYFGMRLAQKDVKRIFLSDIIKVTIERGLDQCLSGYISELNAEDKVLYLSTLKELLSNRNTAWLAVSLGFDADYNDELFIEFLEVLERGWVGPRYFSYLRSWGKINSVPPRRIVKLLNILSKFRTKEAKVLLVEVLGQINFGDKSPFDSNFVLRKMIGVIPQRDKMEMMAGYHWKDVCLKLLKWNPAHSLSLLDALLHGMKKNYSLSYDGNVVEVANYIVESNPEGAWDIVKTHFEKALPKWRSDIFSWLKGGLVKFDDNKADGANIMLPRKNILEWIEEDSQIRAPLIAHIVPAALNDEEGGRLTRDLLYKYRDIQGVLSGISATFHSGGWSGPTSIYLRRKRERCREWLAQSFEPEVDQWIENEIQYLDREIEKEETYEERERFD